MCLITNQKEPMVASEDITVYKVMQPYKEEGAHSLYQSFFYKLGQPYRSRLTTTNTVLWCAADSIDCEYLDEYVPNWRYSKPEGWQCIERGFHAYQSIQRAEGSNIIGVNAQLYRCTIPKGSLYYMEPTGCIVSNQIIINELVPL